MAFEGISTALEADRASARVARRTTDADRGILNRGLPTARVRAVVFDPATRALILHLDTGQKVHARVRYDGRPAPGVYTMRRIVRDVHDGTAFVPDRAMGGTPSRDGYVIAFDTQLRATLAGVQQFTVTIGALPSPTVSPRPLALQSDGGVVGPAPSPTEPEPVAGTGNDAGVSPDGGSTPSDAGVGNRGTDDRMTDDRATSSRGTADAALSVDIVNLSITWWGHFGGDLSAQVVVYGIPPRGKPIWLKEATVEDPDKQGGKWNERLIPAILEVPRYGRYKITIKPLNKPPDDRYQTTTFEVKVRKNAPQPIPIDEQLAYQRMNEKNLADTWQWKKIDPAKARLLVDMKLFGRPVTVHQLAIQRVVNTNLAFAKLAESERNEITESIYSLGSQVPRTTTQGTFSNHSIGVAFDINANSATKQDDHFFETHMTLLTDVIQPVVRLDPAFTGFEITTAKGLRQLDGSRVFNEQFPLYVASLLGRTREFAELNRLAKEIDRQRAFPSARYVRLARDAVIKNLSARENKKKFRDVVRAAKDPKKRTHFELILKNWETLFTWVLGADVWDRVAKTKKRAVGMIPLHPKLLELMRDQGWSWGGDWLTQKDYMHFEDVDVKKALLHTP